MDLTWRPDSNQFLVPVVARCAKGTLSEKLGDIIDKIGQ